MILKMAQATIKMVAAPAVSVNDYDDADCIDVAFTSPLKLLTFIT